jgi:hypothetical protein
MQKTILKLDCLLEIYSENLSAEEIKNSIVVVSKNPEVNLNNFLKTNIQIEDQENFDNEKLISYFRFNKKN